MGWLNKPKTAGLESTPDRDIINAEEATKLLPMSKRMIYERCRQGQLPHFHIGNNLYLRRSEIEEFLRGKEQ